jgi:hypothetical protein
MSKHENVGALMVGVDSDTLKKLVAVEHSVNTAQDFCHQASYRAGWWDKITQVAPKVVEHRSISLLERRELVPTKLMLIVSEISEAMEGHRKNRLDDHLPWREQLEVELADALIRIFDLGGALQMDLGGAVAEKLAYNAQRADHTREARAADNGKRY